MHCDETFFCRGSELDIHLRQSELLFQEGSVMELVNSDDDEFDTLIEAVDDIRILHQSIKITVDQI